MLAAASAIADPSRGYSTRAEKGALEVTAEGAWHINTKAPWRVVVGGTTLKADRWTLSEQVARIAGLPAGEAKVRIFLCNPEKCKTAESTVTVP
ncbi:MAG TPA: hypothetical protein VJN18_11620 [Polyangiaceae bacterium]|nr:hypothetical protein [Polyangiaceae bacterium]